jgi:hypothetical protein
MFLSTALDGLPLSRPMPVGFRLYFRREEPKPPEGGTLGRPNGRAVRPAQGIGGALSTVGGLGGRRRTDPKGQFEEAGAIAEPWQPAVALIARFLARSAENAPK